MSVTNITSNDEDPRKKITLDSGTYSYRVAPLPENGEAPVWSDWSTSFDVIEPETVGGIQWQLPAPTAETDTSKAGDVSYDSKFFYIAIATDTWKRIPLTTITQDPEIFVSGPTDQVSVDGQAQFTVQATIVNSQETIDYQWQRSIDNGTTWSSLVGESQPTLNISGATLQQNGYKYRVIASATGVPAATSGGAELILTVSSHLLAESGDALITENGDYISTDSTTVIDVGWQNRGNSLTGYPMVQGLYGWSTAVSEDGTIFAASEPRLNKVHVYKYTRGAWTAFGNQDDLVFDNPTRGTDKSLYGSKIALSRDGRVLAITRGQLLESDNRAESEVTLNAQSSGVSDVTVMELRNGRWVQRGQTITSSDVQYSTGITSNGAETKIISDGTGGNTYGTGLSLNSRGDVIAVGCPNNDYGSVGSTNGYVEVLYFDGIEWQRMYFNSIGLANNHIFVGYRIFQTAELASDSSSDTSTHWNRMETLGDEFGTSVELNEEGDKVIVGAPGYKSGSWLAAQQNDGAAFVFSYKTKVDQSAASAGVDRAFKSWQWDFDLPHLSHGQGKAAGRLGFDVGMPDSGLSIFAGEPNRSVYEDGSSMSRGGIVARAEQTSSGTTETFFNRGELGFNSVTPGDYFGKQISVSADGLTVAVAIPGSDEGGVNDRGRVKVFRKESGTWSQLQNDIIGPNANSGKGLHGAFASAPGRYHISVSLSKDGETLVVGFPFNEEATGGQQAQFGKVDVYHVGNTEVTLADDVWYNLSTVNQPGGDIEAATSETLAPTSQVLHTESIYRTALVLADGGQVWERHEGTWDQPLNSVTWQSACLVSNGPNPNDPTSSARLQHPILLAVSSDGFIYKRDYLTNSSLSILSGYTNEWKAIRASYRIGYAVGQKTDGSLWEISLTATSTDNTILGIKTDWIGMDGAEGVFAAIDSVGDIYTFGYPNEFGEMGFLGNYDASTSSWGIASPDFVKLQLKNARSVVCSKNNMMIIDDENRLYAYGYQDNRIEEFNTNDGQQEDSIKWWKVFATTDQVSLQNGGRGWATKFYGISTQGEVFGWGDSINGNLGLKKIFRDSLVDSIVGVSRDQDSAVSNTNRGEVLIHTVPSINAVDFSDEKTEGFSLTGQTVPSSDTITFYEPTNFLGRVETAGGTWVQSPASTSSDIYTQVQYELNTWADSQPWEIVEAKLVNNNTMAAFSLQRDAATGGVIQRRLVVFEKSGSTWNKVGSSYVNDGSGINTNSNYSSDSYGAWDISEDGNVIVLQGLSNLTNYTTKFYSKQANGYQEEVSVAGTGIAVGPLKLSADGSKLMATAGTSNAPVIYSVDFVEQTWSQIGNHITTSNTERADSVALSSTGQVLATGGNDIVRVYTSGGTSWSQVGSDITSGYSNAQLFGESIDLDDSGDLVAIGDSAWDSGDGHVRVYENNSGTWSQKGTALSSISGSNDNLGKEVALDSTGSYLMVTAPNAAHPTKSSWTKEETFVGDTVGGTFAGRSTYLGLTGIDFNESGTRVVIPSTGYDTMAYGTTPKNEGKVEVYEKSGSSWSKIGQSIEGDVSGGGSGQALGSFPYMSGDGSRIVFNENYNNLFYSSQYHAQSVTVYEYSSGTWTRVGNPIEVQRTFASGTYSGQPVGCRFRAHGISTDGTRVVVVEQEENDTALDPVIRVYEESGGSWSQLGPDITGSTGFYRQNGSDEIYADISGDGTTVIAGQHDGQKIKVFKYNSTANTWTNIWTRDLSTQSSYTAYDKVTHRLNYFRPVQINSDGTKLAYSTERLDALNVQTGWSGYVLQPTIRYIEIDSLGQESVNRKIEPYTNWHEYNHGAYPDVPSNWYDPATSFLEFKLGESDAGEGMILLKRAIGIRNGGSTGYTSVLSVEYDRYTYQPQNSTMAPASAGTGEGRNWKKEYIYRDSYLHNSATASTTGYKDVYKQSHLSGSKSLSTVAFGSGYARSNLGQLDIIHSTPQRSGYGRLFKYYNPTGSGDDWNSVSIITPDHSNSVTSSCDVVNDGSTTTTSWTQVGSDIDGEASLDSSGYSVSLSSDGETVAIGAPFNDGNGTDSGHVRVYSWNGSAWTQMGADIDSEASVDRSGFSVSLSSDGETVAIGAWGNDGNGTDSGHVRVYSWNGSAWVQLGADIDGEAASDESGYSVSMTSSGSRVAIGAHQNDGTATGAGHVRVFDWNGSAWAQAGADIDGEAFGDQSGHSVSLSSDGGTVAIGAWGNDGNGTDSGHVRVYSWNGSAWTQMGADIDGEAADDNSGWSVSLSADGRMVAIGAVHNDGNGNNSGHVRIYSWSGSAWTKLGADIDGEAAGDQSGVSVSLSSDGETVAIGAPNNGMGSGHVRIYSWNGSAWTQLGPDIDGEAAADLSGWSVSLSSDGRKVAIGAVNNDGSFSPANDGHVRIYSYSTTTTEEVYYAVGSPNNNQVSVREYDGSTTTELGDVLTPGTGLTSQSWYNSSTLGYGTTVKIRYATDLKTPANGNSLYMFIGMPGYDNGKGAIAVSKYNTFQNRWDGFATAVFSDGTNGEMIGTAVGENIGREIDVSSDGKRIVTNVDTLDNTARSRVYEYNSSQQVWQVVNETISVDTSGLSSSTPTVGGVAIDSDGDFTALGYLTLASGAAVSAFGTVSASSSATLLQTLGTTGLDGAMSEDGTRVVMNSGEVYDVLSGTYTLATTIPFDLSDYGTVTASDVISPIRISGDGKTVFAKYTAANGTTLQQDQYGRYFNKWGVYKENAGVWTLADTIITTSNDFYASRILRAIDGVSYDGNYIVLSDTNTAIATYSPQFFMFEYDGTSYKQIGGRSHAENFEHNVFGQNTHYNTAERSYPRSLGRDGKTLIVSTRYIGSKSKVVYPGTSNNYHEYFDLSRRKDAAALIEFKTTINITTQPQDFTPTGASTETLTVAATTSTGGLISYQWQVSTSSGASWSDIIGEQSASLSIPLASLANGKQYRAKLNALGSPEVISSTATVQAATIAITEGAIDGFVSPNVRVYQTVAGTSPSVTLSITATSSAPISYQWQEQNYTGTYSDIAGSNSSSLTLTNLDDSYDGYLYRCKVTAGLTESFSEEKNLQVYPIIKENILPASAEQIDILASANRVQPVNNLQSFTGYAQYGRLYYYLFSDGIQRNTVTGTGITTNWSVNYPPGPTYEFDLRKDGATIQQSSDVAQDYIGVKGVGTYFRRIVSARDSGLSLGSAALTGVSSPNLEFNSLRRDFTNQQWNIPDGGHRWHPSYGQTIQREVATIPLEYGKYDLTQKVAYEQDSSGVYDTSTNFYDFTSSQCYYSAPFVNFYGPHHAGGTSPTFSAFMTHNLPTNSSNPIYSTQLSLQWQVSFDNGANWSNLSGATTDTLSLSGLTSSDNLNQYRLVATYSYGTENMTFTSGAAIFYHNVTPVTMVDQGYAIEKDDTNGGADPSGSPVILTASSNQVITLGNQQMTVSRITLPYVTDLAWNNLTGDAYSGKKLYYTHLSGDHADTFTAIASNEAAGIDIVWETPEDGGTNSEYARYAEDDTAVGSTSAHGVFTGNSPFGTSNFGRSKRFILPNGAWVLTRPIITQINGPSTVGDWTWIYRENH
jgi:hypothetical protein